MLVMSVEKRFAMAKYLKRHILINAGEKPHAYDVCGKQFTLARNLKGHMLIHTAEKRACDVF